MIGYMIAFAVLLGTILLPETGVGGMFNEACMVGLFLIIAIYVVFTAFHKRRDDKKALLLGVTVGLFFLVISVWGLWKIGTDLINGPETIHLTSVTRESSFGLRGLSSESYKLRGYDEQGAYHLLPISRKEYYLFEDVQEVTLSYYPRTERILHFINIEKQRSFLPFIPILVNPCRCDSISLSNIQNAFRLHE